MNFVFAKAMAIKMVKDPMSFLIMDELAEIGGICGNLLFKDEEKEEKGEENGEDTKRRN